MARRRKTRGADKNAVLHVFKQSKKPLTMPEVQQALGIPHGERETLEHMILTLEREGKLMHLRHGAYGLLENLKLLTGKLEVQRSGVGFVIPDDKKRSDIFVSPENFGDAWNGDRVAVALFPFRGGKRQEGRIARVIERKTTQLTVRVAKRLGSYTLCQATDDRQPVKFMVDTSAVEKRLDAGDVLVIAPGEHMDRDLWAGTVKSVLGGEDDVLVQEALVKLNKGVPAAFPEKVLEAAAQLPDEPGQEDFHGRRDLRLMDMVTIDGAKAKDFDDAVCVLQEGAGYRLFVAIADVSYYVPEHGVLDAEARARGNSYYFPQSVEPMFPEALSNGLCSLKPDTPRLAVVAEIPLNGSGVPQEAGITFYEAVIRSKARLTYAQVKRALLDHDEDERATLASVLPMLEKAEALARQLRARRMERGSLDFDLPEPEIQFNLLGETVDIRPKVRHFGHQIIEEFMIAANEAVARRLQDAGVPCLYRVHEEPDPDKLQALFDVVARSELAEKVQRPTRAPTPRDLQDLLQTAAGTEMEYIAGRLALRSMMQAKYAPVNVGHYGLASDCYCHFTSPIRRYADLVVHRSMKSLLTQEKGLVPAPRGGALKQLGAHLSEMERVAMDAEREILKRITVLFLRDRVGEEFGGIINSLADFGFWVELQEVMAEGMVRLSTLHDDYYAFIPERQELLGERTGRRFRMGQSVRVLLAEVNLSRLEVTLELVEGGSIGRKSNASRSKAKRSERQSTGGRNNRTAGARTGSGRSGKAKGAAARKRHVVPRKRKTRQK